MRNVRRNVEGGRGPEGWRGLTFGDGGQGGDGPGVRMPSEREKSMNPQLVTKKKKKACLHGGSPRVKVDLAKAWASRGN